VSYNHIPPRSRPSREFGAHTYPNHTHDNREQFGQSVSFLFTNSVKFSGYMRVLLDISGESGAWVLLQESNSYSTHGGKQRCAYTSV
jgi:hypothetical protein